MLLADLIRGEKLGSDLFKRFMSKVFFKCLIIIEKWKSV